MTNELTLFHGTNGDNILNILASGTMLPNGSHELFFSERFGDALQHGADRKRRASFAVQLRVNLPPGASFTRISVPGNPLAVKVTSTEPFTVRILEMYVRRLPDKLFTITGEAAIRAFLL